MTEEPRPDKANGWIQLSDVPYYMFQLEMWRHVEKGCYLVAEEMPTDRQRYQVTYLSEDYRDEDSDPVEITISKNLSSRDRVLQELLRIVRNNNVLEDYSRIQTW